MIAQFQKSLKKPKMPNYCDAYKPIEILYKKQTINLHIKQTSK